MHKVTLLVYDRYHAFPLFIEGSLVTIEAEHEARSKLTSVNVDKKVIN